MSDNVKCKRCNGTGSQNWVEDGRNVRDVCYRCMGAGRVDPETAHQSDLEDVAAVMGRMAVDDERRCRNKDPEGEGWAFCAAENMMTERDYTQTRIFERSADFMQELAKLSRIAQEALVLVVLKPEESEPKKPAPAAAAPAAVKPADDDIQF